MKTLLRFGMAATLVASVVFSSCQKLESTASEVPMEKQATITFIVKGKNLNKTVDVTSPDAVEQPITSGCGVTLTVKNSDLGLDGATGNYSVSGKVDGSGLIKISVPVTDAGTTYTAMFDDYTTMQTLSDGSTREAHCTATFDANKLKNLLPGVSVEVPVTYSAASVGLGAKAKVTLFVGFQNDLYAYAEWKSKPAADRDTWKYPAPPASAKVTLTCAKLGVETVVVLNKTQVDIELPVNPDEQTDYAISFSQFPAEIRIDKDKKQVQLVTGAVQGTTNLDDLKMSEHRYLNVLFTGDGNKLGLDEE